MRVQARLGILFHPSLTAPSSVNKEKIMNRRVVYIIAGLVCFGMAFASNAKELAEIENELSAHWERIRTYSARIEMKGQAAQGASTVEMNGKGSIEGMKKDTTMLYRMEMDQTISMGASEMPNKMLVVYDGTEVFTQTSMLGQTMVFTSKPEEQSQVMPGGGKEAFKRMHEQFEMKVMPDDTLNDEPVYMLELRPKQDAASQPKAPGKSQFDKALLSLSQKTGFPLKMLMFDDGEKPIMTLTYKEYKLDPELNPARFAYTPPPGAIVMDAESLKQMGGTP